MLSIGQGRSGQAFVRQVFRIRRRAYELARSGLHIDCLTIESQLEQEGHPLVREVLSDPALRARLRRLCDRHWHPPMVAQEVHQPDLG
jgi:hypothetical protein